MITAWKHFAIKAGMGLVAVCSMITCVDPVSPEFELSEGLVFIEAVASTTAGGSFVSISQSAIEFNVYQVKFIGGAEVSFLNTATGEKVFLTEQIKVYNPPLDFVVAPGESWVLDILLADGTHYRSAPETVLDPVPVEAARAIYSPELKYNEGLDTFIPGHRVFIDFTDPPAEKNFYYWSFRSFENMDYCEKCRFSLFRDEVCRPNPPNSTLRPYYDYRCESECWKIRFPETVVLLEDSFTNGNTITNMPVAELPLFNHEDMVVEIQQYSLSQAAYAYYKSLREILEDSRGLNAPPPAALIGNMANAEDAEDFVFGRFTAAATTTVALFIDRTHIAEQPMEIREPIVLENFGEIPSPQTVSAPCSESRFRTAIRPEKWIDN